MKKIIIVTILLGFFLPILSASASVYLNPSKFLSDIPLISGKSYFTNFYISNQDDEDIFIVSTIECFENEDWICPPSDWLKPLPKKQKIKAGEAGKIEVKIKIPKNQKNGQYQAILVNSIANEDSENSTTMTRLTLSLSAIIRFEKQGDLNFFWRLYFALMERTEKPYRRLSASMNNSVNSFNLLIALLGLGTFGIVLKKTATKIRKR